MPVLCPPFLWCAPPFSYLSTLSFGQYTFGHKGTVFGGGGGDSVTFPFPSVALSANTLRSR